MPGGFIGKLIEAIMFGPEGADYKAMSIAGLDPMDGTTLLLPERAFQFWPESLQDTIEVGWQFKDIPGASHALAQWSSNGGRTVSFEVRLHRFMKPVKDRQLFEQLLDPFGLTSPGAEYLSDQRPYNVDVEAEIKYLRAFCYPSYAKDGGSVVSYPPPVALLCVPGVGLNEDGSDTIRAVMTGCDVTYNLLFPTGKPRNATVALTFRQVVQDIKKGVVYRGLGVDEGINLYKFRTPDKAYTHDASEAGKKGSSAEPMPGAARGTNDIDPSKVP